MRGLQLLLVKVIGGLASGVWVVRTGRSETLVDGETASA